MRRVRCGRCGNSVFRKQGAYSVCTGCGAFYDTPVKPYLGFDIRDGVLERYHPADPEILSAMRYFADGEIRQELAGIVEIPYGVTRIGERAFYQCSGVNEVILPDTVTSIGKEAFAYCWPLTDISIPDSVTEIGEGAFMHSGLHVVTIPHGLTRIAEHVFEHCDDLVTVSISDTVRSIGERAFGCCCSLSTATIPGSVESIGKLAFWNCYDLSALTMEEGVRHIGRNCFQDCALRSLLLPDSVTHIENCAFIGCDSLQTVRLPARLKRLGAGALNYCEELKTVTIRGMELNVRALAPYRYYPERDGWDDTEADHWFTDFLNTVLTGCYYYEDGGENMLLALRICADHPEDTVTRSYVRAHLGTAFSAFLQHERPELVMRLLRADGILTADNIDACIEAAIRCGAHEVLLYLTNYKAEHFGYATPEELFEL